MDKYEWREFFRFINTAGNGELERKLLRLHTLETTLSEPDVVSDCKRMMSCIRDELSARREVEATTKLLSDSVVASS